jgi:hypothetical protein
LYFLPTEDDPDNTHYQTTRQSRNHHPSLDGSHTAGGLKRRWTFVHQGNTYRELEIPGRPFVGGSLLLQDPSWLLLLLLQASNPATISVVTIVEGPKGQRRNYASKGIIDFEIDCSFLITRALLFEREK